MTPDGEQGGPSIRAGRQVAFPRFGVESRDDLDELQLGDLDEMSARCPGELRRANSVPSVQGPAWLELTRTVSSVSRQRQHTLQLCARRPLSATFKLGHRNIVRKSAQLLLAERDSSQLLATHAAVIGRQK